MTGSTDIGVILDVKRKRLYVSYLPQIIKNSEYLAKYEASLSQEEISGIARKE